MHLRKLLNAASIANGRIEGNGNTWNAVKIDGEWCQMDLTWDDSDSTYGDLEQRHLYFGLTDELMAIAHSDHAKNYQAEGYAYRSTAPPQTTTTCATGRRRSGQKRIAKAFNSIWMRTRKSSR